MISTDQREPDLIGSISDALSLGEFLDWSLGAAVQYLGCLGGSVYLYDPATKVLELRSATETYKVEICFGSNEGIVGKAYSTGMVEIASKQKLVEQFVSYAKKGCEGLRAIVAVPIPGRTSPQAVYCFDFGASNQEFDVSIEERLRVDEITRQLMSGQFQSALQRMRISHALLELYSAGVGPAHLRTEVTSFLAKLQSAFDTAGRRPPDIAYLQLVDRRRGVVRTVQGFGLPLSLHVSLSHSLDDLDIQANVVRTQRLYVIAGKDPEMFDIGVYKRNNHKSFVRLWLPLFPFPVVRLSSRTGKPLDQILQEEISWAEDSGPEYVKRVGTWRSPPPERLVWGTLELGYRHEALGKLSLQPFSEDLVAWCAAQALSLSRELFHATLAGCLERVGRAVTSVAEAPWVRLSVAMPEWSTPESRLYPMGPDWPAAEPIVPTEIAEPLASPVEVMIKDLGVGVNGKQLDLVMLLRDRAEEAVRVALRLDDHFADQYRLVGGADEPEVLGTAHPDPGIRPILREVCREAGAMVCTHYQYTPQLVRIGLPTTMPVRPGDKVAPDLADRARQVAESRSPYYPPVAGPSEFNRTVILPLELVDGTVAVVALEYQRATVFDDQKKRDLESRIARWVHLLSLNRLTVSSRFSALIRGTRRKIGDARRSALGVTDRRHLDEFAARLLGGVVGQLKALGAALTIYSTSRVGPPQAERFWYFESSSGRQAALGGEVFVGHWNGGPCQEAIRLKSLVSFRPGEPHTAAIELVNMQLFQRARELELCGSEVRARQIERLVELIRGRAEERTMVVCPALDPESLGGGETGALTLFLPGEHFFSDVQERQVLELGELIADAVAQMRSADAERFEKEQVAHLERLRDQFAKVTSSDELVGALFKGMGNANSSYSQREQWGLAEDAVVWLLASNSKELVARSGRGRGLEALGELSIISPEQHPLIAQEKQRGSWDFAKKTIWSSAFRALTVAVSTSATSEVVRAYASLGDRPWLISFPLMSADRQVIGVCDCLRDCALRPEQEGVYQSVLRRVSMMLCETHKRVLFDQVMEFAKGLTFETTRHLAGFHTGAAYNAIVRRVQNELNCAECDLYLERDGRMLLHTSTRSGGPAIEADRVALWVEPHDSAEPVGASLKYRHSRLAHGAQTAEPLGHMSPMLALLLAEDWRQERIALPLRSEESQDSPFGLLAVVGPVRRVPPRNAKPRTKMRKWSGRFDEDHLERARNMTVVVQRTAAMARLVERQAWLVNELGHSVSHPLQYLRKVAEDLLVEFSLSGTRGDEVRTFRRRINHACEVIYSERDRLASFSRMGQIGSRKLEPVEFTELLIKCCALVEPRPHGPDRRIPLDQVERIPPVFAQREWLQVALINLLENAVKYSFADREIEVTLAEEHKGRIVLRVANYGVGIPRRDIGRVWDPYFRSQVPDTKRKRQGSGIGLAIVKHAIEQVHEGVVEVKSLPPRDMTVGETADEIKDIPHHTTFTITFERGRLEAIADDTRRKDPI